MNYRKRVLVIDDDPKITRLLKLNLELGGEYVVHEANDGTVGLRAAKTFQPDLVLLDVVMPYPDGTEVAARLQEHPTLRRIPIVFLTAAISKAEVKNGEANIGGFPFLAKPVDFDEVEACIRRHLARQLNVDLSPQHGFPPGTTYAVAC